MSNMAEKKFLVQLSPGQYFVDLDGTQISVSSILSRAAHLDYTKADQMSQRFRRRGSPNVCVTDHFGVPVRAENFADERAAADERAKKFWGE